MNRPTLLVALFVLILPLTMSGCLDDLNTTTTYVSYPEEIDYVITHTVTMEIIEGEVDYDISIPFPVDSGTGENPIQTVTAWSASDGYTLAPFYGSERMEWSGTTNSEVTVQYQAELTSRTLKWTLSSDDSGFVENVPTDVADRYPADQDEWKIRPTDPMIISIAGNIVEPGMTVAEIAEDIFQFIESRIGYDTRDSAEPKDCVQTLTDGIGDCDDQSILFCSIARAAGIPAWLEFGYLYDSDAEEIGPHAWVAFYMPLSSGGGGKLNLDMANHEFLLRAAYHITTWEDTGDAKVLREYYNVSVYSGVPPFDVEVVSDPHLDVAHPSSREIKVILEESSSSPMGISILPIIATIAISLVIIGVARYYKTRS